MNINKTCEQSNGNTCPVSDNLKAFGLKIFSMVRKLAEGDLTLAQTNVKKIDCHDYQRYEKKVNFEKLFKAFIQML